MFVDEYRYAIHFLSFTTGKGSKAVYGRTVGYNSVADFEMS
jgi:hypothetical protein